MGGTLDQLGVAGRDALFERTHPAGDLGLEHLDQFAEQVGVAAATAHRLVQVEFLRHGIALFRGGGRGRGFALGPVGQEVRGERLQGLFDGLEQVAGADRLGDVAVHPGLEALLAVALHGVGGQGDDGQMQAGRLFLEADRLRRLEAAQFGHLHVHEDEVERLPLQRLERLEAVVRDADGVARLFEDAHREPLVDEGVLREEDSQGRQLGHLI